MNTKSLHILVVEDDEDHACLIAHAFRDQLSFTTLTIVQNLTDARANIERSLPDLVISDLSLPDGLGTQLLPARKDEARFPIVIMTAQGDEEAAVSAMKAGALDYVVKSDHTFAEMPHIAQRALKQWQLTLEKKQAQEEKTRLEAQILHGQKLESLGVMAAGIAHDFNNLLMGVLGNANLCQRHIPADSKARKYIQRIESAGEQAADLTQQLLAYSGKSDFLVSAIDLSQAVKEVADIQQVTIPKKIRLDRRLADDLPEIEADVGQLRQIILNLITNAADAIGENDGAISIRTGVMQCDWNYLRSSYTNENLDEGAYAYLEITDNGIGMSQQTIDRIFDPFFTTKTEGRGLGLASVLGIVRSHKGALHVSTQPGRGSTFRVLFPAVDGLAKRTSNQEDFAENWQGEGTVLIVDDEKCVREAARSILEEAGFDVVTASDGNEGIKAFYRSAKDFAGILLDINMPGKNGKEVLAAVRKINRFVKVIISSGMPKRQAIRGIEDADYEGFLQKPYGYGGLISMFAQSIQR